MKKPLRVLMIEDSEDDAAILARELERGGYDVAFKRVQTQKEMQAAVQGEAWDIVFCDYTLPRYSGIDALAHLRSLDTEVPFIFVSATIGEDVAVEAMRAGANDYVLKGNLRRLLPAVKRELRDVELRREKNRMKQALNESEERYRNLVENISDVVYVSDAHGKLVYGSPNLFTETGYSSQDILGKSYLRLIAAADRRRVVDYYLEQMKSGGRDVKCEFQVVRKDGSIAWVEQVTRIIRDTDGNVSEYRNVVRDITERKRAEKQIRMLAHAARSISECVSITDMEDKLLFVNEAFLRTYGYGEHELLGKHVGIVRSLNNLPEVVREILPATVGGGWHGELLNRRKDGRDFAISLSTSVVRDDKGQPVALIGVAADITERKRAENELKASEEKYRSLVNNINDGFFIADLEGNITFANEALARIQGYKSKDDIIGKHFSDFIPPGLQDKMIAQRRRSLETGKMETLELPIIKADGTTGFIELKPSPLLEGDKIIGDMGVIRDVTERKKLEEQMRQVQKMESIGTLAGGIAHDFNNILGIIMAYASLLQRGGIKPEEMSSSIGTILDAVQRGSMLVRQILTFARKSDVILEDVLVNDVVKELHKMLKETFPKTIEIRCDLDPSISPVAIDSGQLHQALLNLCVNARDAILDVAKQRPGGGVITITTRLAATEEISGATSGSYVAITVSDTGAGMSEETKQKIFDPFFTTKELGKGTGLGLAVVYGIVKNHQGYIHVKSEIGRGTDIDLFFPTKGNGVKGKSPLAQGLREAPGGSETILLVEDEMALLELLKNLFQNKGYTVLTATNGLEAVEVFARHKEMIQLVLSDHGLPKLNGAEAFKRMKQMNSKVKAVLASGFIEPNQKSEIFKSGIKDFVQKPYDPQEVLRKVREVLDLNG